jgi:hypothetical protein
MVILFSNLEKASVHSVMDYFDAASETIKIITKINWF